MLSSPTRPSLERHQSFENTTPCPPYNLSQEDVLSAQKAAVVMVPSPASIVPVAAEEDEIWAEFDRIQDPRMLKEKFYEQHQHMRAQLDMAGRYGLSLQQDVEELQDAQVQSYAQIQSLQDENCILKTRAHHAMDLSSQLSGSESEVKTLTTHNESLQRDLDGCRKDLKSFRRELDNLVEQMTEMGSEVLDAKTKVSVYARRLTEVEQELSVTKEANVDLQVQLQTALDKQKQSQSSTAQVVKNIQSDLGKVLSDSGTIRTTLEELENRQVKCEDKVVEMISNTKEYAHLLEEAQETIQTLRTESDMEGRGWANQQSPQTANWGYQARKSSGQLSTLALEGDPREFSPHELDPNSWDHNLDDGATSSGGAQSLGMELGLGMTMHTEEWDRSQSALETQPKSSNISSPPSTPASYLCSAADSKHLTPATSPLAPSALHNDKEPGPTLQPIQEQQPEQQPPVHKQQQPTPPMIHVPRKLSNASTSLTNELQLRLEEHTILQTVLASPLSAATGGSSRPPWNPSVALENMLPSPIQQRSRSTSRAASFSSRSSSRSVSRVNLHQLSSPGGSSVVFRNGSSTSSTSSVTYQLLNHHQHPMMPSPQTSPHAMSMPTSSLMDAIASQQGRSLLQSGTGSSATTSSSIGGNNKIQGASNTGSRPRSRTTLTASGSLDHLSVLSKTKAKPQGSSSPTLSTSSRASNRGRSGAVGGGSSSPLPAEKPKTVQRSRASSTANPTTSHQQQQQQARRATAEANRAAAAAAPSGSPIPRGTGHSRKSSTIVGGAGKVGPTSSTPPPARPNPSLAKASEPSSPSQKMTPAVVEPTNTKEELDVPGQGKEPTDEFPDLRPSAFSPVPVLLPLPEEAEVL